MAHRSSLIIASVLAIILAAAVIAGTRTDPGGRQAPATEAATSPCVVANRPMNETISRMFALMATDTSRLAGCWTEGKADLAVLSAYAAAGSPTSFSFDLEHSRGREGVLYAAVRVRASWAGTPPPGWGRAEQQTVVMRQHHDWSWTIDTIQPRVREARSDPHCGVCH